MSPPRIGVEALAKVVALAILVTPAACVPAWRQVQPEGAGFVVQLPGTPECEPWRKETAKAKWAGHRCGVELDPWLRAFTGRLSRYYYVSWVDVPAGVESTDVASVVRELEAPARESRSLLLAELQRRAQEEAEKNSVTRTSRPASLGGQQAIHYDLMPPATLPRFSGKERVCLHRGRLFRISIYGESGDAQERSWKRLLESFRFMPEQG